MSELRKARKSPVFSLQGIKGFAVNNFVQSSRDCSTSREVALAGSLPVFLSDTLVQNGECSIVFWCVQVTAAFHVQYPRQ